MLPERWQTYWSRLFYGLLVVATALAVGDVDADDRRVAIVVLAAGLALWYWHAVVRSRGVAPGAGRGRALPRIAAVSAIVGVAESVREGGVDARSSCST